MTSICSHSLKISGCHIITKQVRFFFTAFVCHQTGFRHACASVCVIKSMRSYVCGILNARIHHQKALFILRNARAFGETLTISKLKRYFGETSKIPKLKSYFGETLTIPKLKRYFGETLLSSFLQLGFRRICVQK